MEMYIYALMAFTGGFALLIFVSEIIYEALKFIVRKLDERDKANEKL